jgi:hypothetical protein
MIVAVGLGLLLLKSALIFRLISIALAPAIVANVAVFPIRVPLKAIQVVSGSGSMIAAII